MRGMFGINNLKGNTEYSAPAGLIYCGLIFHIPLHGMLAVYAPESLSSSTTFWNDALLTQFNVN